MAEFTLPKNSRIIAGHFYKNKTVSENSKLFSFSSDELIVLVAFLLKPIFKIKFLLGVIVEPVEFQTEANQT